MRAIILDFYGVILDPTTQLPMEGVWEFLDLLKQKNISCAIASSSGSQSIYDFLEDHKLSDYIQTVIGGDKVSALKPDPECYVSAAEFLNVPYPDCLLIDDTLAPLERAKLLGFQTIHFYKEKANFKAIAKIVEMQ